MPISNLCGPFVKLALLVTRGRFHIHGQPSAHSPDRINWRARLCAAFVIYLIDAGPGSDLNSILIASVIALATLPSSSGSKTTRAFARIPHRQSK